MKTNDIITHFMTFTDVNTGKVRPLYIIQAMGEKVLTYNIASKYDKKPDSISHRILTPTPVQFGFQNQN